MEPALLFIGQIQSPLKKIEDCPLQENENAPKATLIIFPEYLEGVQHIQAGSKILILTWLHLADRNIITCVPRNQFDAPKIGVFSTRSPDRPNPIGIHTAEVISNANGQLMVAGLEVLDQTPLLDIKPVWKPG